MGYVSLSGWAYVQEGEYVLGWGYHPLQTWDLEGISTPTPSPPHPISQDTVGKRAAGILLECFFSRAVVNSIAL